MKNHKKHFLRDTAHAGTQNATAPGGTKIHRSVRIHEILLQNVFSKKMTKNIFCGTPRMRGPKMRRPREGPKSTVALGFMKFCFKTFFQKNMCFLFLPTLRLIRGPKQRRSGRRAKCGYHIGNLKILITFWPLNFRVGQLHFRCLRTSLPSPEGLSGVRRP